MFGTSIRKFCIPPYASPAFSSFLIQAQASIIEVGVVLSGVKTFLWSISNGFNVQANSIAIRDVTTNTLLASGLANDGNENLNIGAITNTSPMSHSWRGEGINTQSGAFNSSNFSVSSVYPYFWGTFASGGAAPGLNRPVANQSLINSGTKVVAGSSGTVNVNFNSTTDDYIWFAIPASNPVKTAWYVSVFNNGSIGGSVSVGGNLFPAPNGVSISSQTALWSGITYNIYISNYQTSVNQSMALS